MKFPIFVIGVILVFWLLNLVVELLHEIVAKLGILLQIIIVIVTILFLLYTYYEYGLAVEIADFENTGSEMIGWLINSNLEIQPII